MAKQASAGSHGPWQVSTGTNSECGVDPNGSLWCWGANGWGSLGIGDEQGEFVHGTVNPVLVAGGESAGPWLSVSVGDWVVCAVRADGTLWCWGGATGETAQYPNVPTQVGTSHQWQQVATGPSDQVCGIQAGGTLWCWGDGYPGNGSTTWVAVPTQVASGETWAHVAVGASDACAITTGGSLYCWGWNYDGQLGIGVGGDQEYASLMPVGSDSDWTAISTQWNTTCGIRGGAGGFAHGTLWCWGDLFQENANSLVPVQIGSSANWTAIGVTAQWACGVQTAGSATSLWCMGDEPFPDGGTGWAPLTELAQSAPWLAVSVGPSDTCVTGQDDSLWCFGQPVLGNGTGMGSASPQRVWDWSSLAAFGSSTCGLRSDGTLWCWGANDGGQLGLGTTSTAPYENPVQVGAQTWSSVSAHAMGSHACAIRGDSTLWCWGGNDEGQLGSGNQTAESSPVQVNGSTGWDQVSAGLEHTCGIWENTLWCWGDNSYGELGTGNTTSSNWTVHIAEGQTWASVSAGAFSTCAVRMDGTLWCWGYNGTGAVGQGSTSTPSYTTPMQVGTANDWASVSLGWLDACATRTDGSLWCWGYNADGELGVGNEVNQPTPVQVGAGTPWLSVSAGEYTTCAVSATGILSCWGYNAGGLVAQGNTTTATYLTPTVVAPLTDWFAVSVGADHACASDGLSQCWGANTSGQLGIGSTQSATAPTPPPLPLEGE